jgi:glutaredoxin
MESPILSKKRNTSSSLSISAAIQDGKGNVESRRSGVPRHDISGSYYNRPMHDVVVYSRKGCHLCEVVKDTLNQFQGDADFQWREIDIDSDPELRQRYNDQVPVVFIDGHKAFKYHMNGHQLLRALAGRE